jgi:predicted DNA-binding transcriptional regulator AlpA
VIFDLRRAHFVPIRRGRATDVAKRLGIGRCSVYRIIEHDRSPAIGY